jgi:hypothetical protein
LAKRAFPVVQPAVFFSQNKPATSNQPAVLFSQNKSAPAIGHQPNEHIFGSTLARGTIEEDPLTLRLTTTPATVGYTTGHRVQLSRGASLNEVSAITHTDLCTQRWRPPLSVAQTVRNNTRSHRGVWAKPCMKLRASPSDFGDQKSIADVPDMHLTFWHLGRQTVTTVTCFFKPHKGKSCD